MTNEMMNLQALLAKSVDPDFLREMIGFAADSEVRHSLNVAAWKCECVTNIDRYRQKRERFEEPAPASVPGMDDGRIFASH